MFSSPWDVVLPCAVLVLLVVAMYVYFRRRGGRTTTADMVRRRRELTQQLNELAGERSSEFVQLEARRQRDATTSNAVLEAAIARARRAKEREEGGGGPSTRR